MNQLSPQEGTAAAAPPPSPFSSPPYHLICLDRSKPFSTVHGDRHSSDPHYRVHYFQNTLPFDANDKLVPDDGQTAPFKGLTFEGKEAVYFPLYNDSMRALVARRLERLTKQGRHVPEPEPEEIDPNEPMPDVDLINLAQWLKGEIEYPINMVTRAVREKEHKHVRTAKEAIEFLSFEKKPPMVHPSLLGKRRLAEVDRGVTG